MKQKNVDLEIIILSYNSEFWLKKTLESLSEHYLAITNYSVQVTVVDNNSQDASIALVKKSFPKVSLIQLPKNVGFAAGNNAALHKSKARYVMLLNSDVECTDHSNFDELIAYLDDHEQVAAITPRIEFSNGELDPACHRGEPTPWASFCYFTGLSRLFPQNSWFAQYHQTYKLLDTIHTIDACSGACMIARQSAIQEVGYLDERFFMYAEDLDWCRRFRLANKSIIFYPQIRVIHHKYKSGIKGSSKQIARKTNLHFYDTMLQYYDKHYVQHYPKFVRMILSIFIFIKKGAL
ncbi:MAG: glycosyltransferase family 2 protein [Patescibacteria group bacterium]